MAKRTCSIDGCDRPHAARGWCMTHWRRWRRTGTTDPATPPPKCSVDGCDRRSSSRGWCRLHYERWQRCGTPERPTKVEQFWMRVDKADAEGCWLWTGAVVGDGYGRFSHDLYAHRYAYELLVGPIPDGLHIDHLCRTPLCVNPAHMEPVTAAENNRRRSAAHRGR